MIGMNADNEVHDHRANAVPRQWLLGGGCAGSRPTQLLDLVIKLCDLCAHDDLRLRALDDSDDARNRLKRGFVCLPIVGKREAQPGGAVL